MTLTYLSLPNMTEEKLEFKDFQSHTKNQQMKCHECHVALRHFDLPICLGAVQYRMLSNIK